MVKRQPHVPADLLLDAMRQTHAHVVNLVVYVAQEFLRLN